MTAALPTGAAQRSLVDYAAMGRLTLPRVLRAARRGLADPAHALGQIVEQTTITTLAVTRAMTEERELAAAFDEVRQALGRHVSGLVDRLAGDEDGVEVAEASSGSPASVPTSPAEEAPAARPVPRRTVARSLRERFAALAAASLDGDAEPDEHPAFHAVIGQLTPDEAQLLALLASRGPQALVDVHEWSFQGRGPLLLRRHSRMGERAGVRRPERMSAYLDNLLRLGLMRIEPGATDDKVAYELLEEDPALEGLRHRRLRFVPGHALLTDFGHAFAAAAGVPGAKGRAALPGP